MRCLNAERAQIQGLEGNVARVKAADGGMVAVELANGNSFDGQFYEFEGTVQTPVQMREDSRASFGSSFSAPPLAAAAAAPSQGCRQLGCAPADMQMYNELVKISASTYSPLFA